MWSRLNQQRRQPGGLFWSRGQAKYALPRRMQHARAAAFSLVEIAVAVALLSLVATGAVATFMTLNKNAATTRIMTNAKEIVQQNIESAIAAPFTSDNVPAILGFTAGANSTVTVYTSRDAGSTATGTLTRTVTAEPNGPGADIRRVTFKLSYTLLGRAQSYAMTTIRAKDR